MKNLLFVLLGIIFPFLLLVLIETIWTAITGRLVFCNNPDFFLGGILFVFIHYVSDSFARRTAYSYKIFKRENKINPSALTVFIIGLLLWFFLYPLLLPQTYCSSLLFKSKLKSSQATNFIATSAKECAVKLADGVKNPTFTNSELKGYEFIPKDRSCSGDKNNLITAKSKKPEEYPTFSYNVETGTKLCSHNGPKEELNGCSARKNGEW